MYSSGTIGSGLAGSGVIGGALAFTGTGGVATAIVLGSVAIVVGVLLAIRRGVLERARAARADAGGDRP